MTMHLSREHCHKEMKLYNVTLHHFLAYAFDSSQLSFGALVCTRVNGLYPWYRCQPELGVASRARPTPQYYEVLRGRPGARG